MPQQVYHSPVYHSQSIQAWEQRWFAKQNSSLWLNAASGLDDCAALSSHFSATKYPKYCGLLWTGQIMLEMVILLPNI